MILSCGEALIDMLPRTSTQGEPAFAPYAGGAVFNTAIALGRLGAPAGFFSGLSTDMLGQILERHAGSLESRYRTLRPLEPPDHGGLREAGERSGNLRLL